MISTGDAQDYWVGPGASRKPVVPPIVGGAPFNINTLIMK